MGTPLLLVSLGQGGKAVGDTGPETSDGGTKMNPGNEFHSLGCQVEMENIFSPNKSETVVGFFPVVVTFMFFDIKGTNGINIFFSSQDELRREFL